MDNTAMQVIAQILTGHLTIATTVSLIVTIVIPLVSSLLGKAHWPAEVLGILTLLLSVADGFFTTWANSSDAATYPWRSAVLHSVLVFVLAIAARYGLWKNTAIDSALLNFGSRPTKVATYDQDTGVHDITTLPTSSDQTPVGNDDDLGNGAPTSIDDLAADPNVAYRPEHARADA